MVRMQPRVLPVMTPSQDLQNVTITLRLLYRPQTAALPTIFKVRPPSPRHRCVDATAPRAASLWSKVANSYRRSVCGLLCTPPGLQ